MHVISNSELGYLALGTVFVAIGLITLLLTVLRAASRDATIFLFGVMSLIWGLRFLFYTQLVPQLITGDPTALQQLSRGLTYAGAAAVFGFTWAYLGAGWRGSLRLLAFIGAAFFVVATIALILAEDRDLMLPAFSMLVLGGTAVVIGNLFFTPLRRRAQREGLTAGLCASALFFVLENLRALGVVPVPWDVEWIGVVILYATLGRLIAVRLFSNERRLEAIRQELATARRIQASLLPRQAPRLDGLAITARYRPMHDVAGDIYDFVEPAPGQVTVLVADVSGHGIPAALIASMVKGAFRAQADHLDHPGQVLAGMNRILTGQLGREFVTASCTFLDTVAGIVRYAGAGHPPLLIQSEDGQRCRCVERNGLILGQFPDAAYRSVQWELASRDRLVLYTDGLIEATDSAGEEFGEDSLRDCLVRYRELAPEQIAETLVETVARWSGRKQGRELADDLTLLVIDVEMPQANRDGQAIDPISLA